jgi:hypothetical protein
MKEANRITKLIEAAKATNDSAKPAEKSIYGLKI